jgi:glucose 1-dehydrogenase
MRLQNKICLVTGAAQGIGEACAQRFAAEGAKVVLGDINVDGVRRVAESINDAGGDAIGLACDVSDKGQVDALVAAAVEAHGRLDVALANAAQLHMSDILDTSEDDYDRIMAVNLKGFFLTDQAAARQMVAQTERGETGGAIINMSSIQVDITLPNILTYSMSKGGIRSLTISASLALADKGVRVNAIAPGSIGTDMVAQLMVDEAARVKIMSRTPLGRLGEPDEVASVAVFLASDEAAYITGETITVDGGRMGLNYTCAVPEAVPE